MKTNQHVHLHAHHVFVVRQIGQLSKIFSSPRDHLLTEDWLLKWGSKDVCQGLKYMKEIYKLIY